MVLENNNGVESITTDPRSLYQSGEPVSFADFVEDTKGVQAWFLSGDLEDNDLERQTNRVEYLAEVATAAADALIDVHQRTGIDLSQWPPVLRLVTTVYPDFQPIHEGKRTRTEASAEFSGEPSRYETPIGRDTFRGAEDYPRTIWGSTQQ
jgi:hypothetical protein